MTLCLGIILTASLAKMTPLGQDLVADLRSLLSALFIGGVACLLMRRVGSLTEVLDARALERARCVAERHTATSRQRR